MNNLSFFEEAFLREDERRIALASTRGVQVKPAIVGNSFLVYVGEFKKCICQSRSAAAEVAYALALLRGDQSG